MEDVGELFAGVLADVQAHPAVGDGVAGGGGVVGVGIKLIRNDRVGRQVDAYTLSLGFFQQLPGSVETVVLAERLPDVAAFCLDKGVGHAAADDDVGGPV